MDGQTKLPQIPPNASAVAEVQQKYIAMTKALIESADVDGYRVDTPMQADEGCCKGAL